MDRATLQAKLGALTPEQQEQLKKLLAAKRDANAKRPPAPTAPTEGEIPHVAEAEDYALSFAQKRLWMQEELSEGGTAAYNVPLAVILRGELDINALEQAFRGLMERHAVLRTHFVRRDGEPRQVIVASPEWAIERWSAGERNPAPADFRQRAEAMAARPFALERELPFRAAVMPLGPQEHGLALTFHHIACDGRSVATLVGELEQAYAQAMRGEASVRPAPKLRYVDYAAWHRDWMASPAGAKAKNFWLQQFAEIPEPLELPGDFPRPSVQDFSGQHLHCKLPTGTRERLAEVGQRVSASLFGTLLAAVVTFLHRYAGRDDITVGSPVEGRPHAELDELVGFFVNTLPLRTKVAATDSFLAVVERVRDGVLEAVEHQGCPFDVMVQSLPLERDLSRPPLFTVMMGLTRAQEETLRLPGVQAEVVPLGLRTSKVDLTFHFVETAEGLELDLEYATALFSPARMQRLAAYFETMLGAALAMPAGPIGDLSLLSLTETAAWLKAANPPPAAYPRDRSLASLFREQVARDRDAAAVAYDGRTFTYAELDRLSDAIAGHLVGRLGALRVDEPIALQVDRSERMLAALLGILKAGGCYLPINPGTPLERVRTLLTMSGTRLRLTEGEPVVPGWGGTDVDLRTWCSTPPPVTASSGVGEGPGAGRRLAYIIFTSGSTGEPKGVLIEQHSVVRLVRNTDYLQLGPGDRVLQTGSLAFDASTFEIWGPLLNGGCCCLPRGKEILEIDRFGALVKATGATTCFLTTGLFNQIADFNPNAFRELKHLLTGGEKVSVPHVNRVLAAAPNLTVLHVYGPTENTTFSTWYRIGGEHRHDVPIGRPLAHSTIYILDERGNVQPPGVVGEIYCGGDGIARGYLGRLDATADRFVPDPFSERPAARLYRTGDFGRWDEAGNVEFAGRRDDQVKIRGFRIELGEVELRLRAQPAVQQAVVIARPSGGTHELVAYLVAPGLESEETLRAGLAKVLPDYMVPSYFVLLETLPLNASGKVNRKALPPPRPAQTDTADVATSFTDPKEQALAAAWADVLGRPPANGDAHYFNSGGDSIKAIQMTARLRARGYRLTLRDVFGRPRFADLAAALVAAETTEVDTLADTGDVPFTPIQQWFLQTYAPPYDHFNQATLLESEERLRPDLLRRAVQQLVDRHGMLRCRLERADVAGGWKQTIPPSPGTFIWREDDLSTGLPDVANTAYETAAAQLQRGLSLADGRLVAAGFFRTPKTDRLLLVIHHWAVDGISWRILVGELETIYRALLAEKAEASLAKPGAFRAWAQSLIGYGKSEALARETRYWEEVTKRIPAGEAAPRLETTERHEMVFAADVTQRLLTEAHRAYGTQVGELLLAAFGQAWADCGGGDSVALAMEGHGRESCVGSVDVSAAVGWFTSMWPFVLSGGGEWSDRIRAVKDAWRAVPERGVGHGVLRYLQGGMAETAVPRISFNYLGVFESGRGALFRGVVDTPTGEPAAAHLGSPFDLDVVGEVTGGCLHVSFHFHRSAQTSERRAELVAAFRRAVEQGVAEGCRATPQPSVSDFTGGVTNLAELDRLVRRCAQRGLAVEDILPLTPMQEGMVFHALYEPHSAAYSDQVVLRLSGALDAKIFQAAWQALGQQYPNLRTTFVTGETERPVGVIARGSTLGFSFLEARDETEIAAVRAEKRAQKFDLETGPLLRLTLVNVGAGEHEAILGFHHSILDGWSSGLIWQRLEENYRALAAGSQVPAVRGAFGEFLRWLRARDTERDLAAWRDVLAGAPAGVAVPTGAPRLGAPPVRTRSFNWEMGRERTELFVASARRLGTTENSLFQTLWGIFLGKLTRRTDVVFGATVSGRTEGIPQVEDIVGLLINTIPVRVTWQGNTAFQDLAERLRVQSAEGMDRLSVSLADIQSAIGGSGSIVQHTLVFENYPDSNQADTLWQMATVDVHDPMHFEFGLLVVPKREGWICRVVADETRYPDAYLESLQHAWHEVVDRYLGAPQSCVEGWEPALPANRLRHIAVAATFTAEPLEDALRFWLHGRGEEADVQFAPFNQVLQQLLNPDSELLRSRADLNVLLVRLEDWAGSKRNDANAVEESLDLNADHFVDGLQRLVQAAPNARNLVLFCPASPEAQGVPALNEVLAAAERRLLRRIDVPRLRTVRAVASRELTARFAGVCIDNPGALGGVPYAEEFFAVMASEAIRRWDALSRAPFKVLALDADQTLWRGVLGEDGVQGIEVTPGHRRLQEVAKAARASGMLLALVTKNNVEDVKEAFRVRADLPLKWDDFVAVEANWQPKSDSLRRIARALNLGLDSFVFLDDSSLECAEVRAALPDVLTLQVPADAEAIERFAAHLWPADVVAASAEDQHRSELYQVESRRQAARATSGGLKDFIRQLQLEIEWVPVDDANLERAAQLTQRTNQFNASTVRRSPAEIREFLAGAGNDGFLLEVKDRFGEYGLTGFALYSDRADVRTVDTLLLSCRVLGRGVEHELLRRLARAAAERGLKTLRVTFARTAKNAPAEQFLRACAGRAELDVAGVGAFIFDVALASRVEMADGTTGAPVEDASPASSVAPVSRVAASYFYQAIASELSSAAALLSAVTATAQRSRERRSAAVYEAPRDGHERAIAEIWAKVLGIERVGRQDDFFALGGHSLKAVMMLSRVNRALGCELLLETIFAAPVLAEFAQRIGQSAASAAARQPIPRVADAADYPLSDAQRRLWLIEQMRTDPPSPFHMAAVFSLRGPLDEARLATAFRRVIERHESLRTGLVLVGHEPRQRVLPHVDFSIEALSSPAALPEFIEREFDLARPPLLRAALRREGERSWTLAVVMHHAVSDGWSIGVIAEELSGFYGDPQFAPEPLPIQYRDYAVWQERQLAEGKWQRAGEYWRRLFRELPSPLELPADRARPATKQLRGADVSATLPLAAWQRIKQEAQQAGASPFVALLAVLQVLLARHARAPRFVIGTPVAGRDVPELEPQVGFFVNLLPIVADVDGGRRFADHLTAVKEAMSAALSHAAYPFDRLVNDLALPRDLSRSPLFDVLLVFQSNREGVLSLGEVELETVPRPSQSSQYDVTFEIAETAQGLLLRIEYATSLFDATRMQRLARQFLALLENAFANASCTVDALEVCPADERERIGRFERGAKFGTYRSCTIPQLVAEAGSATPNRVALAVGERTMTYAELDRRARAIATTVRASGARPQEFVAVAGERSEHFICAMLGVMRAGCVYVPLDLNHPDDRLRMMIGDGSVRHAVAIGATAENRLRGLGLGLIELPASDAADLSFDETVSPADLAYAIFTSGSTGRPKGVEITHESFATMIESQVKTFGVRSDDRCSWWASCAFDASLSEIFLGLTTGATVVIAEVTEREDPIAFLDWLKQRHVTVITLPPAFLRVLQRASLAPVRVLITAGEAADMGDLLHYARSIATFNAYGPTETSVCATIQRVGPAAVYERSIPIGQPLDVASAYVLDSNRRRVPLGVPGELYVGGRIVGRGYRGAPTLTAERFVPDPFADRREARMYRTGDLVRWREDGALEFLGRDDAQVKIRGFRIELGEVENAVRQVDGVRAAAVLPVDRLGAKTLVAYVVLADLVLDALRVAVAERLPDYMRPAAYCVVPRLPMTPNGKLDKAALPAPDWAGNDVVTPVASEPERIVAAAWQEALGLDRLGRESNFFSLGGDSIKALALVGKLRAAGWELGLKAVYAHPVLSEQARQLRRAAATKTRTISGAVMLTPIQKWFLESHANAPLHHFNQALFYRAAERVDLDRLQQAVNAVWDRHAALRATFARVGGEWQQTIRPPTSAAPEVQRLDVSSAPDARGTVARWVETMQSGLNLETGPLVRYGLLREAARDRVLCVTHHLVSDWVSHRILIEDLATAYRTNDGPSMLPQAATELDEWMRAGAAWAVDDLGRGAIIEQWKMIARSAPSVGDSQSAGRYGEVSVLARELPPEATAALRQAIAKNAPTTLRDVILAAMVQAERTVFSRERLAVQLEGHGRDRRVGELDVSRTVGWFTSLYPCVLEASESPDHAAAIAKVAESLAALPDGGATYSLLRTYGPNRARSRDLAVQTTVGFNYLGEFMAGSNHAMFEIDDELPAATIAADFPRDHPVDVTAWIFDGRLHVQCAFLPTTSRREAMERWVDDVVSFLRRVCI